MDMVLTLKQLLSLPVETKSGTRLGVVVGIELDTNTHEVRSYQVRSTRFIPGPLAKTLAIAPRQVISLTEERMIVEDLVVTERERALSAKEVSSAVGEGV